MKVLYLTHDIHADGGIQRYSRYQVRALCEAFGADSVLVCALGGHPYNDELEFAIRGQSGSLRGKLAFAMGTLVCSWRVKPSLVIATHVKLAPLAWLSARIGRAAYWVNVYALEVWGRLPKAQLAALRSADIIVSDCEFTKELLESRDASLAGRISVIPDCVDCDRFTPVPAPHADESDNTMLLTVSRLWPGRSKGHDRVMLAVARLRQAGLPIRYVIGGDGPDRQRLEKLASSLGIAPFVDFRGRVDDDELLQLYRSADIFILVSAFSLDPMDPLGEGVPLVVLEAQACGCPAITSRLDGSRESIVDGQTGLLADPNDTADITRVLNILASDRQMRQRLGQNATGHVLKRFSYTGFRDRTLEVVDGLPVSGAA